VTGAKLQIKLMIEDDFNGRRWHLAEDFIDAHANCSREMYAIEDVPGWDLSDLVGSPLRKAEEVKNHPHEKECEDSIN
jgi:hypothetical protein